MRKGSNGDDPTPPLSESGPAAIAASFRRGSPEAVRTVQERVRKIVWFRGYRMSEADRKDLEQEAMTQIWQAVNGPGFDAGDRFWGFVEVVTARRCIDWIRVQISRGREAPLLVEPQAKAAGALKVVLDRERVEKGHSVLAQLSKPCRDLIYLHIARGESYADLAAALGRSQGALRVQMHRCVARARQLLAAAERESEKDTAKTSRGRG